MQNKIRKNIHHLSDAEFTVAASRTKCDARYSLRILFWISDRCTDTSKVMVDKINISVKLFYYI